MGNSILLKFDKNYKNAINREKISRILSNIENNQTNNIDNTINMLKEYIKNNEDHKDDYKILLEKAVIQNNKLLKIKELSLKVKENNINADNSKELLYIQKMLSNKENHKIHIDDNKLNNYNDLNDKNKEFIDVMCEAIIDNDDNDDNDDIIKAKTITSIRNLHKKLKLEA